MERQANHGRARSVKRLLALAAAAAALWTGATLLTADEPGPVGDLERKPTKEGAGKPRKDTAAGKAGSAGKSEAGKAGATGKSGKVDMSPVDADEKAEKEDLEKLGPGFKVKRTQHYSVLYNTSDEDVESFGLAIEQTYRSCMNYSMKLEIPVQPPAKKLLIFYFEEHKDYAAHAVKLGKQALPQSIPGVYFPDLNRSQFFSYQNQESFKQARLGAEAKIAEMQERLRQPGVSAADKRQISQEIKTARARANRSSTVGGDVSESIVQHEVAHQVLWNIGFHNPSSFFANPRWFAEGTAMMFEPISDGSSANFGAVNSQRLKEYQQLEKAGKLFPLKEFLSHPGFFHSESTIGIAYAQSWALAHYLNRVKRKQVPKYVADINARPADYKSTPEKELAAFEKAFGKPDEAWEKAWKKWMTQVR